MQATAFGDHVVDDHLVFAENIGPNHVRVHKSTIGYVYER
jgi:hypothetical protein